MEYFKAAIIKNDGNIDITGEDVEELHSICLLEYAKKTYDVKIFEQLNFRHRPEVISYFLVKLFDNVVFLNTTRDIEKYGYMGILMMPDNLNSAQKASLDQFLDKINQFNICLMTNLCLDEGILQAQETYPMSGESPKEIVAKYYKSR